MLMQIQNLSVTVKNMKTGTVPGTRGIGVRLYEDGTFTYGSDNHFKEKPDFLSNEDIIAAKNELLKLRQQILKV